MSHWTVSQAARQLSNKLGIDISPRALSALLYNRALPDGLCPIIGGRRMIPLEAMGAVEAAVIKRLGLQEPAHA